LSLDPGASLVTIVTIVTIDPGASLVTIVTIDPRAADTTDCRDSHA